MAYIKSGQLSRGREANPNLLKRKGEAEIERSKEREISWNGCQVLEPFLSFIAGHNLAQSNKD